jgi:hypothetical protein
MFWKRKPIFDNLFLFYFFVFWRKNRLQKKAKRNTHTHTHTKNWVAVKKLIIEKQNEVPKQREVGGV